MRRRKRKNKIAIEMFNAKDLSFILKNNFLKKE